MSWLRFFGMRKSLICFLLCDLTPISSSKSIWHIRYHSSSGPWSKNTIVYSIISIFKRQALEKREMSALPKPSMQTSSRDDAVQLNRAFKGHYVIIFLFLWLISY